MTTHLSWRDVLVELHVLAEHGDADAADRAQRWMSHDSGARRLWQAVEADCVALRHPQRTGQPR